MDHAPVIVMFIFIFGGSYITKMFRDWNEARIQIAKLKYHDNDSSGSAALKAEIEAMRLQMASLRDTTTQYDLSFDTALQRMEQRMAHMEQRLNAQTADRESAVVRH